MNNSLLDVIVVGGGQAGLSISYYLKNAGLNYIVFERGKIGESWRSQRWNSFKMNSINRLNVLPGGQLNGCDPDAFSTSQEYIASLEQYVSNFQLPIMENSQVLAVEKPSEFFKVTVTQYGSLDEYYSKQIIIASGIQNEKNIPSFANKISADIKQLHTSEYRNPAQLPDGAVLVVGSAQSGVQIAEDLIESGKKVYLSTSMVGRVPGTYRGADIMSWLLRVGFFDLKTEDVRDPMEFNMRAPQHSPHTISLQDLAGKGATILGKMESGNGKIVFFQPNARQNVQFADMISQKVKEMIDGFIEQKGLIVPPPAKDKADVPDPGGLCASSFTELNLKESNITTIIWTTGFCGNFSYIKLPVFGENGNPKHKNGISEVDGLYFLGFGWLRSRKSFLIHGLTEDAGFIFEKVRDYFNTHQLVHSDNMAEIL
ncbi:MAG TPA: NAD(P)/FAD-dependent oxidoreductase [Parafilimonas sp.]|nr:NAD(P)/FAD-dependent oxidoreductase [Parafilimonas sp.]